MKRIKDFFREWGEFLVFIIASLMVIASIVSVRSCMHGNPSPPVPCDTIVIHDTLIAYEPSPVVERFVPIEVERVDTVYIVEDYQMLRVYADTVHTSYGQICITDTVYQNRLLTQKVEYDLTFAPPDKTRRNSIAIGGGMSPMGAMATIQYRHKRWGYEGGYDFLQKAPMIKISYDLLTW